MEKRPLDYAKASMDTMMRKWEAPSFRPKEDSIIIREYSCPECTKAMNFAKRKNILITSNPGWMPSSPKTV